MRSVSIIVLMFLSSSVALRSKPATAAMFVDGSTGTLIARVSEKDGGKPVAIANTFVIGKFTEALVDTMTGTMRVDLAPGRWIVRVQVIHRDMDVDTIAVLTG